MSGMTVSDWDFASDPFDLEAWLARHWEPPGGRAERDRRLRLAAVACARACDLVTTPQTALALLAAELMAEGRIGQDRLDEHYYKQLRPGVRDREQGINPAIMPLSFCLAPDALRGILGNIGSYEPEGATRQANRGRCVRAIQEVVGCPFRAEQRPPLLVTADMVSLARAALSHRMERSRLDPVRLAILADSAEEAGCTDKDILWHLRGIGPWHGMQWIAHQPRHYPGCWAVDEILRGQK